jgi:hypothetical protein
MRKDERLKGEMRNLEERLSSVNGLLLKALFWRGLAPKFKF